MSDQRQPPGFSFRIVRWLCKQGLQEELEGDLHQFYEELPDNRWREIRYWYQVVNYLRPATLKSFKNSKTGPMFIFNPLLTIRNLYRHKSTSLISIFGFTLGLVATFFLYFYIQSELSTDRFHAQGDTIYRVLRESGTPNGRYRIGVTSGPFAKALATDFPSAITSTTRVMNENGLVSVGDRQFYENRIALADPNFFEFFSFPLLQGDPATVLEEPNSVVLSKQMVKKYFGDEDPVGKEIRADNQFTFIVTGVMDELPGKTHIGFDFVASIQPYNQFDWFNDWWSNGLMTYVQIPSLAIAANVQEQLPGFMQKYFGEDFERMGYKMGMHLEPLHDVYFNKDTRFDNALHGDKESIYILGIVAIAILFIACFNYVNLTVAQSFSRAKEVGVRKVLGVETGRLLLQFLGESLLILAFSILISIGICELINPVLNRYFDLEVVLNWLDPNVILFFGALMLMIILAAGLYPATVLSSFKPVAALKGSLGMSRNVRLRKGLVVAQFAISIFLIIATSLIFMQKNYLTNKDLGFNKDAVLVIRLYNAEIRKEKELFIKQIQSLPQVVSVSNMSGEPGGFHDATSFQFSGLDGDHRFRTVYADSAYLNVLDLHLVAGRGFDPDITSDQNSGMLVNESALRILGISADDIIGRKAKRTFNNSEWNIIGVVEDYHFASLHDQIEPIAIMAGRNFGGRVAVKLNRSGMNEALIQIEAYHQELAAGFPLQYDFLDESLRRLYENEQKQARIFTVFSGISILLACLGIFGLAAYSSKQRQKELGIRKVLGATAYQLIRLISHEFVLLVLIASFIAIPVSWLFIDNWLENYAYRIDLANYLYVFVLGGLATMVVALLTIVINTYRSAIAAPTESIRNE